MPLMVITPPTPCTLMRPFSTLTSALAGIRPAWTSCMYFEKPCSVSAAAGM